MPKARKNAGDQVVIGLNFASDWLREWREFSGPITEQIKAKTEQSRITFDAQLKIAPFHWPKKCFIETFLLTCIKYFR